MLSNPRLVAAIALMALGAGLSARRWVQEPRASGGTVGAAATAQCSATGEPGTRCELPPRAWTIAGVPLAALGVAFYGGVGSLLLLAILGSAALQRQAAAIAFRIIAVGVVIDVILLGIQLFVRHETCGLCLATYGTTFVTAALLFRPLGQDSGLLVDPAERRMLLGGWAVATAVVLVTVTVGELGLRQQARAQDLQATLDSPAKRDAYDADQAVLRFQAGPVNTFDLKGAPRLGGADGPIVVVEYVDYLCPFCRQLYGGLDQYLAQQNGRVSWYFKNLPLDTECNPTLPENYHPGACWLARGAVCAQGAGKWVEFYRAAFTAELENPGPAEVTRLGAKAGLDRSTFDRCIRSPATNAVVAADVAESIRNKAQGTPTLFINGRRAPLWTYVERLVTAEGARLKVTPLAR
jgi:protein-disulfide isomerase